MKRLRTLKLFQIFSTEIKKSKTYNGWCPFWRAFQWYHSHADPTWPDGTFKKCLLKIVSMFVALVKLPYYFTSKISQICKHSFFIKILVLYRFQKMSVRNQWHLKPVNFKTYHRPFLLIRVYYTVNCIIVTRKMFSFISNNWIVINHV
jgi:hypothetical protein